MLSSPDLIIDQFKLLPQFGYQQVVVEIEAVPLLAWLNQQPANIRGYWQDKAEQQVAFIGVADSIDSHAQLQRLSERLAPDNSQLRFYGGIAFHSQSATWPSFPQQRFVLPRFEIRCQQQCYHLIVNANFRSNPQQELLNIAKDLAHLRPSQALPVLAAQAHGRQDTPDKARWNRLVRQVTDADFQQHTAKVVLSRQTKFMTNGQLNSFSLLDKWQQQEPNCYGYLLQFDGQRSFVGCSPERLYARQGEQLQSEALAGTAARSSDPDLDRHLGQNLIDDDKNQRENVLVLDDVKRRLRELSLHVEDAEQLELVKLSHVQHLKRTIIAKINPALDDVSLLDALHPTPAVGGMPRSSAMRYILKHEGYARGWYAGAVGWISGAQSEFTVAIRSALVSSHDVCAFAGAGIVAGSQAELEWQELNHKIATLSQLLNGS